MSRVIGVEIIAILVTLFFCPSLFLIFLGCGVAISLIASILAELVVEDVRYSYSWVNYADETPRSEDEEKIVADPLSRYIAKIDGCASKIRILLDRWNQYAEGRRVGVIDAMSDEKWCYEALLGVKEKVATHVERAAYLLHQQERGNLWAPIKSIDLSSSLAEVRDAEAALCRTFSPGPYRELGMAEYELAEISEAIDVSPMNPETGLIVRKRAG